VKNGRISRESVFVMQMRTTKDAISRIRAALTCPSRGKILYAIRPDVKTCDRISFDVVQDLFICPACPLGNV
jgi:hypothetical protein